mmetsp:Transcript_22965/g.23911  ORF Transcript_22965/g.23911 Transcript_22965/m.23911 type:complete len:170 (+) Transcript_22965:1-510(+)
MKKLTGVKLVSNEVPVILGKALEMFIIDFAYRSWIHTLYNKRKTLRRQDMINAISYSQHFDFLMDTIPESTKERIKLLNNTTSFHHLMLMPAYENYNISNISSFPLYSGVRNMNTVDQLPDNKQYKQYGTGNREYVETNQIANVNMKGNVYSKNKNLYLERGESQEEQN